MKKKTPKHAITPKDSSRKAKSEYKPLPKSLKGLSRGYSSLVRELSKR